MNRLGDVMTAGKLRGKVQKGDKSFGRQFLFTVALLLTGLLTLLVGCLGPFTSRISIALLGILFMVWAFVVGWRIIEDAHFPERLRMYEEGWREIRWTVENLKASMDGVLQLEEREVPEVVGMTSAAISLIHNCGLGPYSPRTLFATMYASRGFEERQRISLGMVGLLAHKHLVWTSERTAVWSPEVRKKFFSLPENRMPDDFVPSTFQPPPEIPRLDIEAFGTRC